MRWVELTFVKTFWDKASNLLKDRYFKLMLITFAAIVIVKTLFSLRFTTPYVMWDDVWYDSMAQNVLTGRFYTRFISIVGTLPPGYSIVIAPAYLLSGNKDVIYHIMLVINALLSTSIIFPSYFILKKYCSKGMSFAGALIVTLLPTALLYTFTLMSENLFIPLFVFSAWFLLEAYETNKISWQILAVFSVISLYMTRSTGIAMVAGFAFSIIYCLLMCGKSAGIFKSLTNRAILIVLPIVLFLGWVVYTSIYLSSSYSMGTPYAVASGSFINIIIETISNIDLLTLVHEIDYIALSAYAIIFLLAIFLCTRVLGNKDRRSSPMSCMIIYVLVSSISLLGITLWTLCVGHMLGTDIRYMIFGRYIEPMIPMLFIFGIIGLCELYDEHYKPGLKGVAAMIATCMIPVAALALTLPSDHYKYQDTNSLFYIQSIHLIPVWAFVVIFILAMFTLLFLSFYSRAFKVLLMVSLIATSLIVSIPVYKTDMLSSHLYEDRNQIGRYLQANTDSNTVIVMDGTIMDYEQGRIFWALTSYWTKGYITPVADISNPSNITVNGNHADYLASMKTLDYPLVCRSDGWPDIGNLYLYDVRTSNTTIGNAGN